MELAHLDHNNNCLVYASDMKSTPPSSPDISDIVGAPQLNPRLGDEYQVETPPMITESERLKLLLSPADSELVNDHSYSFAMGLPVPLIWVHNEVEESKSSLQGQSKAYGMAPSRLSNSWSDADEKSFLLGLFIFGKNFIQIKRFLDDKGMGEIMSFYYGKFYKSNEYRRWSDCRQIKGRKCMTGQKLFTGWRQHELVSRLNSKVTEKLQDTLLQLLSVMSLDPHFAHVYKQISKSYAEGRASLEEYIFSLKSTVGLGVLVEAVGIGKEKEDLTRLAVESGKNNQSFSVYPCVPTGKAWSSLEPSDIIKFLTGGFRLSKAKSNDLFWEAVWPRLLARGWHSEQPNNNPGFVSSRDYLVFLIPGVKKFSRRKLVKGNHYFDSVSDVLSKVVSEPNLLELEVEEAKAGGCTEEGGLFPENASSDKDDQFDSHRPCYLKPRVPTFNIDDMKFTVVDTSLVYRGKSSDLRELKSLPLGFNITSKKINQMTSGNTVSKIEVCGAGKTHKGDKHLGEANHKKGVSDNNSHKLFRCTVVDTSLVHRGKLSSKVRELRCVPVELKDTSKKMAALSREIEGISSKYSPGEKEATVQLENREKNSNADCLRSTMDVDATINKRRTYDNINNKADKFVERQRNPKTCKSDDKLLKKILKQQSGPIARSGQSNNAAPPIKRRRLTACAKAETSRILEISSGDLGSEKPAFSRSSSFPEANKKSSNQVSHKQNVCFVASPAEEVVEDDKKGILLIKNCPGRAMSCSKVEKCESQQPINSNIIEVPPKSENDEMMEEDDKCQNPNAGELVPNPVVTSSGDGSMEQNPDMNQRRHSTRNRPLTVRALESIESDFMMFVQRNPKKKEDQAPKDPFNPCRRARTRVKATTHRHSLDILNTCLGLYLILFDSVNPVCNVLAQKKKLSDKLGSQWSKDELERFYEAYRKHGKDWKKVAAVERNRSTEMVGHFTAYLSLPEGTASVVGLIAMMTDHYNVLEGSDSERESNDAFESGNLQPRAVGKRTPRFPVSYYKKDDRKNYVSPNKRSPKSEVNGNDDEVAHVAALALTEAAQRGGSPQVSQTPYRRAEKSSPVRSWGRTNLQSETSRAKFCDASMYEECLEGSVESRGAENGEYARDSSSLMNMEGVGTVEIHRKGKKIYRKRKEWKMLEIIWLMTVEKHVVALKRELILVL
ncbi:uncharacterized protein G2W53_023362 [Senna tora]|uniref:SANT domain-containing protein n=1 Tax=Senna tora TaxID=362788 RepID=A0A834TBN0_9FABA|nr:uncharacterized protein G2W53_023362 [Senna tora]